MHSSETRLNPVVKSIIMSDLESIYGPKKDIKAFTESFSSKNPKSLLHALSAAEVAVKFENSVGSLDKFIESINLDSWAGVSVEVC